MPRDGEATRERILAAATSEFATFGIAGARVERIAHKASANKAQIYAFFGNKETLFDIVYARAVSAFLDAFTLDAADLPGYSGVLYDAWLHQPQIVRLQAWARLERHPVGELLDPDVRDRAYRLQDVREQQRRGAIRADLRPIDVVALVLSMSLAWGPTSMTTAATPDESVREHRRRKRTLADAVARIIAPSDAGE